MKGLDMNKDRRQKLKQARTFVEIAADYMKEARSAVETAEEKMNEAREIIEECRDEEQEYKDNMPESLQSSEKGEQADVAVDAMETALDADVPDFEDLLSKMDIDFAEIKEGLDFDDADEITDNLDTAAE
jgi:hypothetical protein